MVLKNESKEKILKSAFCAGNTLTWAWPPDGLPVGSLFSCGTFIYLQDRTQVPSQDMWLSAEWWATSKQWRASICETRFKVSPESIFTEDLQEFLGREVSDLQGELTAHIHPGKPWKTGVQKFNYSSKWGGLKRSLEFINIQDVLLLLPESEKLKDSLDSKCQVVKLSSHNPYNTGFYLNSGTTSSLRMSLTTNMAKMTAPNND